jgi:hypothetical protein
VKKHRVGVLLFSKKLVSVATPVGTTSNVYSILKVG